jgi:hypothetical protein
MKLSERIHALLPASVAPLEYAKAKVVTTTSIGVGLAIFALVLYWILTGTLEQIETIFVSIVLILLFAGIVVLVKKGFINTGAWIITGLVLFLNLSNMAWYGIGSSASAGYIIAILLAAFSVSPRAGMGVTILGCGSVFLIAYLASMGQLQTEIPYQVSNLSFDAPALSLIYLITGILAGSWVGSTREAFTK